MRVILHCDLNNFYASCECLKNPDLRDKCVAVCGNKQERHGIVLAKNELAKKMGVKTGMVIWEAERLCPNLVVVKPNMQEYVKYSQLVRNIYKDYTDLIEPFGIDEAWLDVTNSKIFGTGEQIANIIRERVKKEIGLTISVGVSFNKVFAKLASDLKKPDATTIISVSNYKKIVYPLPINSLIYIGKSTEKKLNSIGVKTIGELSKIPEETLSTLLGKWGVMLYKYANGFDDTPVIKGETETEIKSVSNSMTAYRDLTNYEDVKMAFYVLAESVVERVKEYGLGKFKKIVIWVKDSHLKGSSHQKTLSKPTILIEEVVNVAMQLFKEKYDFKVPIRAVGVGVTHFGEAYQIDMFSNDGMEKKKESLENCISDINKKYGKSTVNRGLLYKDKKLTKIENESDYE